MNILPEGTALWGAFINKVTDNGNRGNVKKLVEKAATLLDHIIETFPNYTLHNRTHAENVIRIMGELLGVEGLKKLTDFECAVLILSAYFHDIGMVFTKEDRNNLAEEDDFKEFVKKYPEVRLKIVPNDNLPLDLAEWYCRWVHPKRVSRCLKERGLSEFFKWNGDGFEDEFNSVCKSHGEDIETLIHSEEIVSDYDDDHDLKFCAILLRLADILDFDRSRSPEVVYDYLGLNKSTSSGKRASQTEWRKHLCSKGFRIRDKKLSFRAKPDDPAVEYDVRQFLEVIENELRSCSLALDHCSARWRDFKLPYSIYKTVIKSKGYIYGEHKFALDQKGILNLLMGENLYENPYVFVRELLQNAIDTSRHRKFYENRWGVSPIHKRNIVIEVTHWADNEGYKWVRFDDYGMGMNKHIIENYFLKIGKSYYNSPDFKADILEYKLRTGKDFSPISRFGIGILSCFIAGDRVEISTKHENENERPIRLSLLGLHGFFVMRIKKEEDSYKPDPMPSNDGNGERFRETAGTTVAVRLDPAKETEKFDIEMLLKKYLLYPDIEVKLDGNPIVKTKEKLYEEPWISNETIKTIKLPVEDFEAIEEVFGYTFEERPKVEIIPVNLQKNSLGDELEGLLIIYNLGISEQELEHLRRSQIVRRKIELDLRGNQLVLKAVLLDLTSSSSDDDARIIDYYEVPIGQFERIIPAMEGKINLSHNGIGVPGFLEISSKKSRFFGGTILLYDKLRPNISVARDIFKGLDWNTYSAFYFAFRRALRKNDRLSIFEEFKEHPGKENFLFAVVRNDPLLNSKEGWKKEEIVDISGSHKSINQIIQNDMGTRDITIDAASFIGRKDFGFFNLLISALLQMNLKVVFDEERRKFLIKEGELEMDSSDFNLFPPLFFVPYANSNKLRKKHYPLNLKHDFSRWLVDNGKSMSEKYPGIFYSIREELTHFSKKRQIVTNINALTDRLLELDKSFGNKEAIRLKMEDFD